MFVEIALQEEEFSHALKRGDGMNPSVTGALGMILGMPVYIDNNLAGTGATNAECAYIFHRSAVGFAYATYSAITVTAILLFGIIKYNQIPNIWGVIGIILIVAGVLIVNLLGKAN